MSYRSLDATEIVKTLRTLEQRIAQRFPESGLAKVCHELVGIGEDAQRRAEAIATPNIALRITIYVAIVAGLLGLVVVALVLTQLIQLQVGNEVFGLFQGIDAAMNITVLTGAARCSSPSRSRTGSSGAVRCASCTCSARSRMSSTCTS